jgi:hypothetical protein
MILLIINIPERIYYSPCSHCETINEVYGYQKLSEIFCFECRKILYPKEAKKERDPAGYNIQVQETIHWKEGTIRKNTPHEIGRHDHR